MSRIGKQPVPIPDKVKVSITGDTVFVEGPKGKVQKTFAPVVKVTVVDKTKVKVEGADKQLVGAVTAEIRGYYPPEPYKGKGVRIVGERVRRKEGKTVA